MATTTASNRKSGLPGGILAGRVLARFGTVAVVIGGAVAATVAYLTMGLTSAVVVATAAMIVETLGIGVANVATMSLRQAVVPTELLGRVGNAFRMCLFGAMPLGALAGGVLAHTSLRLPFLCAAAIQLLVLVACGPALARRIRETESALRHPAEEAVIDVDAADAVDDDRVLELVG